ncbi:MAG TPA: PLP-dependent aminotransferase family protein [Bryobacteraceae bacterium]|jgi:GntR family transcriptional regulator/MocR family aminotransferase
MATFEKLMVPFLALNLDRRSRIGLQRQLYDQLRTAILSGTFSPGTRIPSTRELAADLGVSRNTVAGAFDQLLAEGYLEGKVGSGTFVAAALPEELLRVNAEAPRPARSRSPVEALHASRRGQELASIPLSPSRLAHMEPRPFRPGIPALDQFPRALWARMAARLARHAPSAMLTYGDPAGYRPLRQAIAEYLRVARAVRCAADQVIVTDGTQQAFDLAARVLLDPGDTAWVEDPGYLGSRAALRAGGICCMPVPVDTEGISVRDGMARAPHARLVFVTPSHEYPLGVIMSLARRMALLEWARKQRAWIVEDDYDSEFRYRGRPLASLQGLDEAGRVIYTGSFSKTLFPGLRLGYVVAPEKLVETFVQARALASRSSSGLEQFLAAEFLSEGHFGRHVRRMRALYAERQQTLLVAVERELAGALEVQPSDAGQHLVAWLPAGSDDAAISAQAAAAGVIAPPLSAYSMEARLRPGLLLGYTAYNLRQIREGARKLAAVLQKAL